MEPTAPTSNHARRRSGSLLYSAPGNKQSTGQAQDEDSGHRPVRETRSASDTSGTTTSEDVEMDDIRSDEELDDDEETGLTQAERKKRKRRKQRNRALDQRVAASGDDFQSAEKRMVDAALVKNLVVNAILIGLWYGFSIGISVYNKWMFDGKNLNFPFPLFTTSIHMLVQFFLAALALWVFPQYRPGASAAAQGYSQISSGQQQAQQQSPPAPKKPPLMTKSFYLTRIAPCGTATALDIGLGNFSLRFITLTFYTMCKSSVLAFVLLFAFLFRLEHPTWKLILIIALMTVGVVMMVAGEAAFDTLGFVLVMSASFCSGFRWSLTQILLLRNPATSNPFSSIFFLTPVMFLALFLLALPIEGPADVIAAFGALLRARGTLFGIVIMLFPGCLAFMMVAAEFALLKRTSVVTLSVCGIFKEVLTISAASLTFGDDLSPINISGLCVTIASIAGYNVLKYAKMRQEAKMEAREIMEESSRDGPGRKGEEGHDQIPDEFAIGRDSSDAVGLMRDSLTLATSAGPGDGTNRAGGGALSSQSPTKRPEDLE